MIKHQQVLQNLVLHRSDVDILYETGSGGSRHLLVEQALGPYINVFTSSFPFFARYVLTSASRQSEALKKFEDEVWYALEFREETQAIEELRSLFGQPGQWFTASEEWVQEGRRWAGREHHRRWLVATLHHYGALAIDLNSGGAIYCPSLGSVTDIQSTVSAGDVFRGAFCYALVKYAGQFPEPGNQQKKLLHLCTEFAVWVATEKCRFFSMHETFHRLQEIGLTIKDAPLSIMY